MENKLLQLKSSATCAKRSVNLPPEENLFLILFLSSGPLTSGQKAIPTPSPKEREGPTVQEMGRTPDSRPVPPLPYPEFTEAAGKLGGGLILLKME